MAMLDLRRQDRRTPVHTLSPFWVKSSVIAPAAASKEAVLFSFPVGPGVSPGVYQIHSAVVKVEEAFDGSASITAGLGTIPLETTTTGGTVSAVDADQLIISADVTEATLGYYPASGSQFITDLGTGKITLIIGADATVPVVYASLTGTPTVGKCRLLLLLSRVE